MTNIAPAALTKNSATARYTDIAELESALA